MANGTAAGDRALILERLRNGEGDLSAEERQDAIKVALNITKTALICDICLYPSPASPDYCGHCNGESSIVWLYPESEPAAVLSGLELRAKSRERSGYGSSGGY